MNPFNDLNRWSATIVKAGSKPPPGFSPIPGGSKGGHRKPKPGGGYDYWYADGSTSPKLQDRLAAPDVRRFEAPAKPKKKKEKTGDKKEFVHPHRDVIARVAEFAPNRPIPIDATDVKLLLKPGEDPHKKALVSWVNSKGITERSYSAEFDRRQAHVKWNRVAQFAPKVEEGTVKLREAMDKGKTRKDRDAATVVALMQATGIRPGSRKAAEKEKGATFGATTLKPEHVTFEGDVAKIQFIGKSSQQNTREVTDPQLVAALKARVADPTPEGYLFAAAEKDTLAATKAAYGEFKQKDLRTLVATMIAAEELSKAEMPEMTGDQKNDLKKILNVVNQVSAKVSDYLDNTLAMARTSYIPPALFAEWMRTNDIAGGYVKDLFKGAKQSVPGLFFPVSDAGKELFARAVQNTPADTVEDIPHEGDTDFEYEVESYPINMHAAKDKGAE